MKNIQTLADTAAISLSLACTVHCLALPFIMVFLPALSAANLADESFHQWMLIAVIPTSFLALALGCKKHRHYRVLVPGIAGISLLVLAATLGHDLLGERGETVLTVLGACIIAAGHYFNHRLCRQSRCACHH
ncbi:hypothetical protein SIN8267_02492 [Sinobacterium norvegicum]|uniref:MerC domain-containing protein n=1 Tax=Sinobacterium norvegicum TaxID=1641715 RepID=A0ABN8EIS5_9GAMM|nr:MerC domain-containing protein [Sinobacterium norvegicum]CAH0992373.1 hypothetical protein SIN8267_02492 [Sinobacterium norvegicum]